MSINPLLQLKSLGQSIWLDYIRRDLMANGSLQRLIEEDGVTGLTSNPAIFEQAIAHSNEYDQDIRKMHMEGIGSLGIYERLSQHDVLSAADLLRAVYDSTQARDGYVSLEVNPRLAHDTAGTVIEARRLWTTLNRPNILIKVPATDSGLLAIETLISEGINVNVTLVFGLARYRQVVAAYIAGLEARAHRNEPLAHIVSVASFFISRIDTLVDLMLDKHAEATPEHHAVAHSLQGEAAVASGKLAYQIHRSLFGSDRFRALAAKGGTVQRLLFASTGTKSPQYGDTKYVEALIGANTVTTLPLATLEAYRSHGKPELRIEQGLEATHATLARLRALDIDIDNVTQQLETEGISKFSEPFDNLMRLLSAKESQPLVTRVQPSGSSAEHPS